MIAGRIPWRSDTTCGGVLKLDPTCPSKVFLAWTATLIKLYELQHTFRQGIGMKWGLSLDIGLGP